MSKATTIYTGEPALAGGQNKSYIDPAHKNAVHPTFGDELGSIEEPEMGKDRGTFSGWVNHLINNGVMAHFDGYQCYIFVEAKKGGVGDIPTSGPLGDFLQLFNGACWDLKVLDGKSYWATTLKSADFHGTKGTQADGFMGTYFSGPSGDGSNVR